MTYFALIATIFMGLAFAKIFYSVIVDGSITLVEPDKAIIMAEFCLALTFAGLALFFLIRTFVHNLRRNVSE